MKYEYRLLTYIHDTSRQEMVNVGLLYHCPSEKKVIFGTRSNTKDLKKLKGAFPDLDVNHIKKYLSSLSDLFEAYQERYSNELSINEDLEVYTMNLLASNAGSMQWGRKGSGITENSEETFCRVMDRYVLTEKTKPHTRNKSDADVWGTFKASLAERNMLDWFKPTDIPLLGFKESFKYTYQNGALHCLQPMSLDLSDADEIEAKLCRARGRHEAVLDNSPDKKIKFYYLLGKPHKPELQNFFEGAKEILGRAKEAVLITEDDADMLPKIINQAVNASH